MTLITILDKANQAYSDGFLAEYYDENTGEANNGGGDSLARFIVSGIRETYNPASCDRDQIVVARQVLSRAIGDLEAVQAALEDLR